MHLIGMPDSAFVRRVAITMQLLGLRYEHSAISVFSTYEPWEKRLKEQLFAALTALEHAVQAAPLACAEGGIDQAGVTVAVTWRFTQLLLPELIVPAAFPALAAHSAKAERLQAFIAVPPV
jgi:hypothetical protein